MAFRHLAEDLEKILAEYSQRNIQFKHWQIGFYSYRIMASLRQRRLVVVNATVYLQRVKGLFCSFGILLLNVVWLLKGRKFQRCTRVAASNQGAKARFSLIQARITIGLLFGH